MKKITVLFAIFVGCFSSFSYAQPCHSLRAIDWLLGSWHAVDGNNVVIESWQRVSPLTYEGIGEKRSKASNALKGTESMRLVEMSRKVFYLAKVRHNKLPVPFKLSKCTRNSALFENSNHDFPQRLHYELQAQDKLTVTVSGGEEKSFTLDFVKQDAG